MARIIPVQPNERSAYILAWLRGAARAAASGNRYILLINDGVADAVSEYTSIARNLFRDSGATDLS